VARQVKGHPGPALLIGAGITWLIMDAADDGDERPEYRGNGHIGDGGDPWQSMSAMSSGGTATSEYGQSENESGPGIIEKTKNIASHAKEAVTGAAGTVREKLSGFGDAAHGMAESVSHRAHEAYEHGRSMSRRVSGSLQSGYRSGAEQFQHAVEEYPLGVGIGFAALGALVGLLLPRTRGEDELLGERSDQLIESVKEAGKETLERGKAVVERVAESAAAEAEKQGLTGEAATSGISELASKAGEVLRKAKEEAGKAAEEQKLTPAQLAGGEQPQGNSGGSQQGGTGGQRQGAPGGAQ